MTKRPCSLITVLSSFVFFYTALVDGRDKDIDQCFKQCDAKFACSRKNMDCEFTCKAPLEGLRKSQATIWDKFTKNCKAADCKQQADRLDGAQKRELDQAYKVEDACIAACDRQQQSCDNAVDACQDRC